eukprot:symbB.v1.2.008973.t1/scaffold508.1/size221222/22
MSSQEAKLSTDAEGQTEQPFQEAKKGNVTERGPAEDCAREFVHGIILETEKAIEGLAQEVAAACAREAAEGYVTKAKALVAAEAGNEPQHEEMETSGVVDPAGCARVAVADWVQAAEKAVSEDQGPEREAIPLVADVPVQDVAVGPGIKKEDGAASEYAAAEAHDGPTMSSQEAKLSTDAEGQTEQPFQEAEKGNVTERGPAEDCAREFVHGIILETEKAIEGLAQEVAAACAREAAEGYVTKAKALVAAEAGNEPQHEEMETSGQSGNVVRVGPSRISPEREAIPLVADVPVQDVAVGPWIKKARPLLVEVEEPLFGFVPA